ncbi:MAG: FtsX-like permease family protein [Acidimicrobiales bacterium]
MTFAVRELRRRPARFLLPTCILLLLALLLLYPSAVLDGLYRESTGALRTAPGDLVVYSDEANRVLLRSRIEPEARALVDAVPGVAGTATFDAVLLTGSVAGHAEPMGLAVLASEEALGASPAPAPGEALVDATLGERAAVREGDEVFVGPLRVPVTVVGFVDDTNLWFQAGMVVAKATWLQIAGQPPEATGSQALLVRVEPGADVATVAAAIDRGAGGETDTLTPADAVRAMPGVAEQEATFGYIRAVTIAVAVVVVGLFLSFVTLERAGLYAVLKAVGASSRQLFGAVVAQVLLMTGVAVALAAVATWGLTQLPLELPTAMRLARLIETLLTLGGTALLGSSLALRRVVRVDPAAAIG